MLIIGSLAALATSFVLLALDVDPVPGFFYLFAWYPTIVLLFALAEARRQPDGPPLPPLTAPGMLSLWLWSAPAWMVFEVANFRLQNWYYVFVPPLTWQRWIGTVAAFATVLPALVLAERLLHTCGVGQTWKRKPFAMTDAGLTAAFGLGLAQLVLALAWPGYFFPLIWGALFLLCDPYVFRKRPDLSLLNDIANGEWGRVGRLALGGAAIGLLWEFYNFWSRAKWIYTVPGFENFKLFEMPLLGFVGFPFFALEAWAMYHALCAAGVAIPMGEQRLPRPGRTLIAIGVTAMLSVGVLRGIDRWTVSSVVPNLAGIRDTAFVELAMLRGIGAEHARRLGYVGVSSVCDLALSDAQRVWRSLQPITRANESRPTPAEVRAWHRAAVRSCVRSER